MVIDIIHMDTTHTTHMDTTHMDTTRMNITNILDELNRLYPGAACSLKFSSPIQLLISTQLSAQCTDARVNTVTPKLFRKYSGVNEFANADKTELENIIRSLGFYRNKTKNIIACCKMLVEQFDGKLPDNLQDMLKLPGVGRKTANLVLWEVYKIPGVVVDTHVARITKRLGLTDSINPAIIEKDLMKVIPEEMWSVFSHQLVLHGRLLCMARKPKCEVCPLNTYCLFNRK